METFDASTYTDYTSNTYTNYTQTVPDTTADTVPDTTADTVPDTTADTAPETVVPETVAVAETIVPETVAETIQIENVLPEKVKSKLARIINTIKKKFSAFSKNSACQIM